MPKMTGPQYEKKVKEYLRNHLDHLVVHRLRTNQPLTDADLKGLEVHPGGDRLRGWRDPVRRTPCA